MILIKRQARAVSSAPSNLPKSRRGFLSTAISSPPLSSYTQPIATQENLQSQSDSVSASNERDKHQMQTLMRGTRQAGALASVRAFETKPAVTAFLNSSAIPGVFAIEDNEYSGQRTAHVMNLSTKT